MSEEHPVEAEMAAEATEATETCTTEAEPTGDPGEPEPTSMLEPELGVV